MPPKKMSEEARQAAFTAWQQSDEYMKIQSFTSARLTIQPIEMGTKDITDKWDQFLTELYELGSILKVPGRKAKCKVVYTHSCRVRAKVHAHHVPREMREKDN